MACNCLNEKTDFLREKINSTVIVDSLPFASNRVMITGKYHKLNKDGSINKKWVKIYLFPKYCPFCGKPYVEKEEQEEREALLDRMSVDLRDPAIPIEEIADRYVRTSTPELRQQLIEKLTETRIRHLAEHNISND